MINIIDETYGLDLKDVQFDQKNNVMKLTIRNKMYLYKSNKEFSTKDLYDKFCKIQKYSDGKALAWLKKNSNLVGAQVVEARRNSNMEIKLDSANRADQIYKNAKNKHNKGGN